MAKLRPERPSFGCQGRGLITRSLLIRIWRSRKKAVTRKPSLSSLSRDEKVEDPNSVKRARKGARQIGDGTEEE